MAEGVKRPDYLLYKGRYFPPTTPEWMDYLLNEFSPRDTDILIATYPRSGTTWLQNVLHILKTKKKLDVHIYDSIPFLIIPQFGKKSPSELEDIPAPRMLKTHLPWDLVPKNDKCKYIYCYRNPKDVFVSLYHHTTGSDTFGYHGTIPEFWDLYLKGEVEYGSWFDHVISWWEQKDNPNVFFLSYEDLQCNFKEKVLQIAAFAGFELSEELYELIAEECSFQTMKSNKFIDRSVASKPGENSAHIRKGTVGGWKDVLTADQSKVMDEMIETKLKGLTIKDKLVFEL